MAKSSSRDSEGSRSTAVTASNNPEGSSSGDDLQQELKRVLESRESDIPLELRIEAEKVKSKLGHVKQPKEAALDAAVEAVLARPFLGKSALLFNARDEDYTVTYDSRAYVLPAQEATEVPAGVAQHIGPGTSHLHYGITIVFGEEADSIAIRGARDAYMQWLGREIKDKVGRYNAERARTLQTTGKLPAPDLDTAFFLLKAQQYPQLKAS